MRLRLMIKGKCSIGIILIFCWIVFALSLGLAKHKTKSQIGNGICSFQFWSRWNDAKKLCLASSHLKTLRNIHVVLYNVWVNLFIYECIWVCVYVWRCEWFWCLHWRASEDAGCIFAINKRVKIIRYPDRTYFYVRKTNGRLMAYNKCLIICFIEPFQKEKEEKKKKKNTRAAVFGMYVCTRSNRNFYFLFSIFAYEFYCFSLPTPFILYFHFNAGKLNCKLTKCRKLMDDQMVQVAAKPK